MTTPITPTRSAPGLTWSASTSSVGLSTPTRLTSTSSNALIGAGGRGNPLSLRLYKILGARYEDSSMREVLEILSEMYAPTNIEPSPSSAAPPGAGTGAASGKSVVYITARRSDKVGGEGEGEVEAEAESDGSEDGTVVSAPRTGAFKPTTTTTTDGAGGNDSAVRARKNLKRDVETKMARSSRLFLSAFREVDKNLDALQKHVESMQAQYDQAYAGLETTNDACRFILERAEGLRVQRQTTLNRQNIVTIFLAKFTLTDAETEAITSRDVPVGRRVFEAMDRCEQIKEDCRYLTPDGVETKAGSDVKALISSRLDTGYDKLYRWTQDEFRQLARDIHAEPSPILREAVRRLRRRPVLFSEALGTLSSLRQTTVLAAFIAALTRGGPGGYPRPIELHAHEPTRYVGDMLAWVHQATAGEREFLDSLFEVKGDNRMVGSVRVFEEDEVEGYIRELLDADLEKICVPLRVRVQQTVKSQEGSITSYRITNLLQFYMVTMRRTIGEEPILSKTLTEITEMSYKVFTETLETHGRSLLRFLHPPEIDLTAPMALRESCLILREIMQVYDSALLEDQTPEEQETSFTDVLEKTVDPMLEMCTMMAGLMKTDRGERAKEWDTAVFLVNCLVYLEGVLQPFAFTKLKIQELERKMDEQVQILVAAHYERLLHESALTGAISVLNEHDPDVPLSHLPSTGSQHISAALQGFDSFLSVLDVLTSPHLALLSQPRLATLIHRAALERVATAYDRVCEAVRDPKNKYEFSGTLLGSRRPFGQMEVLFQILGLDDSSIDQ